MKKKKMKKIANLTLLTTVVAGTTALTSQSWAEELVNDFNQKVQTKTVSSIGNKTISFDLNDWTSQDNGSEIVLSAYNGSQTNLLIPGEINGQRVVLTDLSIFPQNLQSLTIQETNGQKVGLQTTSLDNAFFDYYNLHTVDLRGLDTAGVTSMESMFELSGLKYADLSGLNVSNVTNMNGMFQNINPTFIYDFTGWQLNASVTTKNMFKQDNETFGLIITTDSKLKNYDYETGNVLKFGPWFFAEGQVDGQQVNGKFADRSSSYRAAKFQVLDSRDKDYIQELINEAYNDAETPTATGYNFLGYGTGPYTLKDDSLEEIFLGIECSYTAEWEKAQVNQAPTIFAPNLTVSQGANFNPLDYVTATDPEDGPITLTEANIVSSDFNIDEPGVYQITYEVADKEGLTARATATITVDAIPVINVNSKIIQLGEAYDPLDGVTAHDNEDGPINLTLDNVIHNPVDPNTPGSYQVWYEVKDTRGNIARRWITILVNEAPKLTLNMPVIKVGTTLDLLNWVTVTDKEQGTIGLTQSNTKVTHNINPSKPGIYQVTYEVTDGYGGVTTQTFDIVVNDNPTITTQKIELSVGSQYNLLDYITATDAHGNIIQLDQSNIVFHDINISAAGTYQVTYEVTDKYGYKTTVTVDVVVKDRQENLLGAVTVGQGQNLTLNQIIQMTGNGYVDGNINITSSSVNLNQAGQYEIIFEYTNADGSVSINRLPVIVEAKKEITLNAVTVGQGQNLTLNQIIQMTGNGYIEGNITITSSSVNLNQAGQYEIIFEYVNADGTISIIKLPVIVQAQQNGGNNGNQTNQTIQLNPVKVEQNQNLTLNEIIQSTGNGYIDGNINITSSNVDLTKPGNYEIIFEYTQPDGTVSINKLPVIVEAQQNNGDNGTQNEIITEKPVYIQQGDKVDLNELIQSSNESFKDKVITIISSNLDTTKPGNYEVIFEVQHTDGTTSSHKLPVVVETKQEVDNDNNQNNNGSQNGNQENSQNNGNEQSGSTNENGTTDKESSSEDDRETIITGVSSAFLIPGAFSLWQGIRLFRRKK